MSSCNTPTDVCIGICVPGYAATRLGDAQNTTTVIRYAETANAVRCHSGTAALMQVLCHHHWLAVALAALFAGTGFYLIFLVCAHQFATAKSEAAFYGSAPGTATPPAPATAPVVTAETLAEPVPAASPAEQKAHALLAAVNHVVRTTQQLLDSKRPPMMVMTDSGHRLADAR